MAAASPPPQPGTPLVVGYVAGAHGIHGGLRVRLHHPDSSALTVGRELQLLEAGGVLRRRATIRELAPRPGTDQLRVWIEGVDERDAAEALRGLEVAVARDQLPPLEVDEFYLVDLIGAVVVREIDGVEQDLGTVIGIGSNGVQDLLEVEWQRPGHGAQTWLLPVLPEFMVTVEPGRVVADLPQDFLPDELERGGAGEGPSGAPRGGDDGT